MYSHTQAYMWCFWSTCVIVQYPVQLVSSLPGDPILMEFVSGRCLQDIKGNSRNSEWSSELFASEYNSSPVDFEHNETMNFH